MFSPDYRRAFALLPFANAFPASSKKPTCYLLLQIVGLSYTYFTFPLSFPPTPIIPVFLSFSPLYSKGFLLFQSTDKPLPPPPWWFLHRSSPKLSIICPSCWPLSWLHPCCLWEEIILWLFLLLYLSMSNLQAYRKRTNLPRKISGLHFLILSPYSLGQ